MDIVFNISEGFKGRNRESQVPAILDLYNIPFVGADALTLGVTLDKVVAKKCFIADGIPTARYFKATLEDNLFELNTIGFPLFVKTLHEGTSKGITQNSRVENFQQLKEQVEHINRNYKQPALVEEFIKGTEFTVAVIGNNPPKAMPVVQYAIAGKTTLGNEFYSYRHVAEKLVEHICPAPIDEKLAKRLQDLAVRAYKSVDCRDFGRVDFRVDEAGNPYVLEINPLPNLSPDDVFVLFGKVKGMSYNQIINKIMDEALVRLGLIREEAIQKMSPVTTVIKEETAPSSGGPNIPLSPEEQRVIKLFPGATLADWEDWRWQIRNRIRTLDQIIQAYEINPA